MTGSKSKISFYHYNASECIFEDNATLQLCAAKDGQQHVTWINILGIEDKQLMHQAAETFGIHPLVLEDILNPNQRAKVEDYGNLHYIVLRMFAIIGEEVQDQQVSIVMRNNMLITFRETDFGIFKKFIGDKLIAGTGALRKKGEDYLLYTLLDVIIDQYYAVLEDVGEHIDKLEHEIFRSPENRHLLLIQRLKGEVLYMRKNIIPVRDLITNLTRSEIEYFESENKYYLRDLQDHMTRNVEELDFQRDQLISLMDLYYSLQTHKMNNVMKTLTGVSFVLLPLTFIASLYGMNFKYMPRLEDKNGFWEVVVAMALIATVLTSFAFRRNWLSTKDFDKDRE